MKNRIKRQYDIAVLLATHKRTDALSRSLFSLIDRARNLASIQFIIGIDDNDNVGLEHFTNVIEPVLVERDINYTALVFEPMGYMGLNRYYNALAADANADWLWVWCDDAICETEHWDDRIRECTGEFRLLKVHTHNEHPYSIFPIFPVEWHDALGQLSRHQLIDTEASHMAYMMDLMKIIEIDVTHDRSDLTGNNADENASNKKYLEGNPNDPRDFYHPSRKVQRHQDCETLQGLMERHGLDTSWWQGVKQGRNNPSTLMQANDPNRQTSIFDLVKDNKGRLAMKKRDVQ